MKRYYAAGERIGAYEVIGFLGAGGMGEVYEASDGRSRVALKVLRSDRDRVTETKFELSLQRIQREFAALLPLRHPNVVRVSCFGSTEDGLPYFVMEFIDGTRLDEWLETRPGADAVRRVFLDIARGLGALHRLGIVHRDVKPENVMVRPDGEAILIDFGIVKSPAVPRMTPAGRALGTLLYTPPELVALMLEEAQPEAPAPYSPACDVYALGTMYYEALAHRFPFTRPTWDPWGHWTLRAILEEQPPHPSDVAPEVPRPLGDFILRMLHKDPSRRVRDGDEVAAGLERGGTEAPEARPEPAVSGHRARRRVLRWIATAGLGAVVLGAVLLWHAHGERALAKLREVPLTQAVTPQPRPPPEMGEKPRIFLIPDKPFPGQKLPPCNERAGEVAIKGGCWQDLNRQAPCFPEVFTYEGRCYRPLGPDVKVPFPYSGAAGGGLP